jgi:hypothetical protein
LASGEIFRQVRRCHARPLSENATGNTARRNELYPPSLRGAKRRSNPVSSRADFMDCFAALAMTALSHDLWQAVRSRLGGVAMASYRHVFAFSQRGSRPSLAGQCPSKIRGRRECRAPGAPAAACAVVESTRVNHHGHTGNTRHSPRSGFNGFLRALPGDRACLPPSLSRLHESLTPASGRQDHTASPSASHAARLASPKRPPHPAPTSVTIMIRPSCGTGCAERCR